MPHNTRTADDAAHRPSRSLIHILTKAFFIALSVVFFTTVLILSFLHPELVLSSVSSLIYFLARAMLYFIETAVSLFLLYFVYWFVQAVHICYYMMKRRDERNRHQAQIFGHANAYFVDEWCVLSSEHRLGSID